MTKLHKRSEAFLVSYQLDRDRESALALLAKPIVLTSSVSESSKRTVWTWSVSKNALSPMHSLRPNQDRRVVLSTAM
jgi:hypothetical protein